eukprot:scaffold24528_cov120-Isochrysis_galbana.AAC.7
MTQLRLLPYPPPPPKCVPCKRISPIVAFQRRERSGQTGSADSGTTARGPHWCGAGRSTRGGSSPVLNAWDAAGSGGAASVRACTSGRMYAS